MTVISKDGAAKKFLNQIIKQLDSKNVKVGWFPSAKYPDGKPVAQVAYTNEFGDVNKHIPPRPFMRPTIREKRSTWNHVLEKNLKRVLLGEIDLEIALKLLGEEASGDVKDTIASIWSPPLAERTKQERLKKLKNKKETKSLYKPLIDTGIMFNTCLSEVTDEE